jgi:hypothetical protein
MSFLFDGLSKSKSPSIPLFQRGRASGNGFHSTFIDGNTPFEKGGQGGFALAVEGGQR